MTKLGWPVAQPRLRRRPSARMMTRVAVLEDELVDLGLDVHALGDALRPSMSISLSK